MSWKPDIEITEDMRDALEMCVSTQIAFWDALSNFESLIAVACSKAGVDEYSFDDIGEMDLDGWTVESLLENFDDADHGEIDPRGDVDQLGEDGAAVRHRTAFPAPRRDPSPDRV